MSDSNGLIHFPGNGDCTVPKFVEDPGYSLRPTLNLFSRGTTFGGCFLSSSYVYES
jgi:hypothetical protein